MCTINEDHMIYDSWNIRCDRQTFLTFLSIFCFFSPLTTWKIKILTSKKTPGDIVILHICTINDNHMIYGFWDVEHVMDRIFVILDHILHFYPPKNPKNQNFKKIKKTSGDIIILDICTVTESHLWCMVPEIMEILYLHTEISSAMDRICCHFGQFFALLPP